MSKFLKIIVILLLLSVAGKQVTAQVKGESGLKWYSWNASGGFILPIDPFNSEISAKLFNNYDFTGIPGYTFSIGKPLTINMNLGAELNDIIIDGNFKFDVRPFRQHPFYSARMRTYNLYAQYYIMPNTNINHFIMVKAGYSRINKGFQGIWDPTRSLSGKNTWEWVFTGAYGITWHFDPNLSFNIYAEFSPVPNDFLFDLYPTLIADKSYMPTGRVVLSLTGHTDIRVFFPFSKARRYTTRYKPDVYLPFYRVRIK